MDIVKEIGEAAALEQLAEECCELAQAALKKARELRGENPTPVSTLTAHALLAEETADVIVCLETLLRYHEGDTIFNEDAIFERCTEKLNRWKSRLAKQKNHKPLKPCRHCGAEAAHLIKTSDNRWSVRCEKCGCGIGLNDTLNSAVTMWNNLYDKWNDKRKV